MISSQLSNRVGKTSFFRCLSKSNLGNIVDGKVPNVLVKKKGGEKKNLQLEVVELSSSNSFLADVHVSNNECFFDFVIATTSKTGINKNSANSTVIDGTIDSGRVFFASLF